MSKSLHETMLWDLQPPPRRTRAGNINILRMRVDCVGDAVKEWKMPIDVWQHFLTDQMTYEIVQNTKNTNVWD